MRADLSPAEESAVETLDGVFAALDLVEFEVDITLGVGIEGDVDDLAVFFGALGADVVFELFDPGFAFFSGWLLAAEWSMYIIKMAKGNGRSYTRPKWPEGVGIVQGGQLTRQG